MKWFFFSETNKKKLETWKYAFVTFFFCVYWILKIIIIFFNGFFSDMNKKICIVKNISANGDDNLIV
jgi:hypothetical protein